MGVPPGIAHPGNGIAESLPNPQTEPADAVTAGHADTSPMQAAIACKLNWHLLSRFCTVTVLSYLDRTNLAFAAVQLNQSLGFTEKMYGLGSSLFFVTYSSLQIPSNLALSRFGAPTWLAIIMAAWGLVATAFAWLRTPLHFYVLRLLLGAAEAGTIPGMWAHLALFYDDRQLGVAYSYVSAAQSASQVLGAPIAAALLSLDGLGGIAGWRWLFLAEGLPTLLYGGYLKLTLAERPESAACLDPSEREWLGKHMARHAEEVQQLGPAPQWWHCLRDPRVWTITAMALGERTVKWAIVYWTPLTISQIISRPSPAARAAAAPPGLEAVAQPANAVAVALLSMLPFAASVGMIILNARHSRRTGERRLHITAAFALSAVALVVLGMTASAAPAVAFIALVASTSITSSDTINLSYIASIMEGPAAATCIATVNSVGNVGGLLGPFMLGALKRSEDDHYSGAFALAAIAALSAGVAYRFHDPAPAQAGLDKRRRSAAGDPELGVEMQQGSSRQPETDRLLEHLHGTLAKQG